MTTPLLPRTFTGAGDLTAAMFLAHLLRGATCPRALASTAAVVFGVLRVTVDPGGSELAWSRPRTSSSPSPASGDRLR